MVHYGSMSSVFDILPRLHGLLALLLVKAQNPELSFAKLVRLTRTIVRLTRLIIREEAAAAHHKIKTAMLANPQWRARVIWELGGVEALQIWRQQFWFKRQDQQPRDQRKDSAHGFHARAADNGAAGNGAANPDAVPPNTAPPKPQYRFRLKQPSRPFYGRRPAHTDVDRPYEPKPAISLMDMPIPLMPYDFWPPLETKSAVPLKRYNVAGFDGAGPKDEAKPDDGKPEDPPPTYDPP